MLTGPSRRATPALREPIFGSNLEPILSLADLEGSNSCKSCTYTLPSDTVYELEFSASRFRVGWGEKGSEHEGWYPWRSGSIVVR